MVTTLKSSPSPVLGRDLKTDYEVFMTYAYNIFTHLDGNRNLNPHHVVRLKNAMQKKHLFSPIIINKDYQIIDGQHRFEASKSLNLPVYYIKCPDYGLEEIQILNSNSSNWRKTDYLQGYCDLGLKPYIEFRKFMQDFPDFGVGVCNRILTGSADSKTEQNPENGMTMTVKSFENGKLRIRDIGKAYDCARKILQFKPFYKGYYRIGFVIAVMHILENDHYKHKEMLAKLALQHGALKDCTTTDNYKIMLENAYNYKRVNKVNIRY